MNTLRNLKLILILVNFNNIILLVMNDDCDICTCTTGVLTTVLLSKPVKSLSFSLSFVQLSVDFFKLVISASRIIQCYRESSPLERKNETSVFLDNFISS